MHVYRVCLYVYYVCVRVCVCVREHVGAITGFTDFRKHQQSFNVFRKEHRGSYNQ